MSGDPVIPYATSYSTDKPAGDVPSVLLELATRLLLAMNEHAPDRVAALLADDYEGHDIAQPTAHTGREPAVQLAANYLQAFPDLRIMQEDVVVQGDRVVVSWVARGTHRGVIMNIPPTGRACEVRGTTWLVARDSRITRGVCLWDVAGFLRCIGLLPEL